jgi:hypothetical protein
LIGACEGLLYSGHERLWRSKPCFTPEEICGVVYRHYLAQTKIAGIEMLFNTPSFLGRQEIAGVDTEVLSTDTVGFFSVWECLAGYDTPEYGVIRLQSPQCVSAALAGLEMRRDSGLPVSI